ncbi:MAG: amidohydrolase family protein [Spirochaetes bacterium]|jgi:predicted TIM-barrel fold metal-dependent hydrolase|nr:amidohydrolase family protein [Spirochaetota bacterium]
MIIDAHAHITEAEYGSVDLLVKSYDKSGIDKGIVVPGGMVDVREMSLYITGEKKASQEIPNHVVFDALKKYPDRLKGFVCINPLEGDKALETFQAGISAGCVGVKLNPMSHTFAFSGNMLDTIADECGQRHMPIYSHTLFNPGASTTKYAEFAKKHLNTNFIIGHMGFGALDTHALNFAAKQKNLFLETSSACFLNLVEALKKTGANKIIFGTEFPMSTSAIELFKIDELPISESDRNKILFENISSLVPSLSS